MRTSTLGDTDITSTVFQILVSTPVSMFTDPSQIVTGFDTRLHPSAFLFSAGRKFGREPDAYYGLGST